MGDASTNVLWQCRERCLEEHGDDRGALDVDAADTQFGGDPRPSHPLEDSEKVCRAVLTEVKTARDRSEELRNVVRAGPPVRGHADVSPTGLQNAERLAKMRERLTGSQ